ncbi:hypothetical protein JHK87_008570 [Glycine soja]|nr:hypothetical protein JHK87_008570 [Glycine soja]
MAFCKRAFHLCSNHRQSLVKHCDLVSLLPFTRHLSQAGNVKRVFLVDTLGLVRGLEAKGVPYKQAKAITSAITEVLNDSLENVTQSLVPKSEKQKLDLLQESNLSNFKSKVQSSEEGFVRTSKQWVNQYHFDNLIHYMNPVKGEGSTF